MRIFLILLPAIYVGLVLFTGCGPATPDKEIAVAFYNCENLFDTIHDPGKDDVEFTPGGKYHYTQNVYEQKIHNIATVLQAMNEKSSVAIIGLAEVENNHVLRDLTRQPEIAGHSYKYEWFDGPDPRGINVAMLYDPKFFTVLRAGPLHIDLTGTSGKTLTRDVLYVYGILNGDTVHVFINHWPSRTGGEEQSAPKRAIAAAVDKKAARQILAASPGAKILVMGDFNDNPGDSSIAVILGARGGQSDIKDTSLYNPWLGICKSGAGTEEYRGGWNLFDQIIVSGSFLHNKNHKYQYDRAEIFKPGFIVDHYKGHEGEPHRSFVGPHWINGYSDHFPVMLYLNYTVN